MRLPPDEVQLWSVELSASGPAARRDESHRALRRILSTYLDEDPQRISIRCEPRGKPRLADPDAPLRFNLSHSGDLALVAVTREREIGVDVEREDPARDFVRLARRALGDERAEAVRRAPPEERAAVFYAAWVRREAIAKCHGAGLGVEPPVRPVSVQSVETKAGYAAAVALTRS